MAARARGPPEDERSGKGDERARQLRPKGESQACASRSPEQPAPPAIGACCCGQEGEGRDAQGRCRGICLQNRALLDVERACREQPCGEEAGDRSR